MSPASETAVPVAAGHHSGDGDAGTGRSSGSGDAGAGHGSGGGYSYSSDLSGSTNPGSTNPGSTNPGSTNPGSTNPGSTNPGSTNPGSTNPGSTGEGAGGGDSDQGDSSSGSDPGGDESLEVNALMVTAELMSFPLMPEKPLESREPQAQSDKKSLADKEPVVYVDRKGNIFRDEDGNIVPTADGIERLHGTFVMKEMANRTKREINYHASDRRLQYLAEGLLPKEMGKEEKKELAEELQKKFGLPGTKRKTDASLFSTFENKGLHENKDPYREYNETYHKVRRVMQTLSRKDGFESRIPAGAQKITEFLRNLEDIPPEKRYESIKEHLKKKKKRGK